MTLSYREYQLLTLILIGLMLIALLILEYILRKFNVLQDCFNIFTFRKKRLLCYDVDITSHPSGRVVRAEAKFCLRVTILMALTYIWTTCVIEQKTYSNTVPVSDCNNGAKCFVTRLSFDTLFDSSDDIGCDTMISDPDSIPDNSFINCSKTVQPNLLLWLQHLAIAYALCLLSIRLFEILTWGSSRSIVFERFLYCFAVLYTIAMVVLFLTGLIATFVSSFVALWITFTIPIYFKLGGWAGNHLREIKRLEYIQNQAKAQSAFVSELRNQDLILGAGDGVELDTIQKRAQKEQRKEEKRWLRLEEERRFLAATTTQKSNRQELSSITDADGLQGSLEYCPLPQNEENDSTGVNKSNRSVKSSTTKKKVLMETEDIPHLIEEGYQAQIIGKGTTISPK